MNGFKLQEAIIYLAELFPTEGRKKPEFFHSIRVAIFLWNNNFSEELSIAGLLHDVLEDTNISEKEIFEKFGDEILKIVKANTKNEEISDKFSQKEDIVKKCSELSQEALIVKLADVYDNFLYYKRTNNISEIERCKVFANLIKKYRKDNYNNEIFNKLVEILD